MCSLQIAILLEEQLLPIVIESSVAADFKSPSVGRLNLSSEFAVKEFQGPSVGDVVLGSKQGTKERWKMLTADMILLKGEDQEPGKC